MERLPTTNVCPADGTILKDSIPASDNPLSTLSDAYEFICEIGRGGMAVIYKAKNRKSGRVVAIKKMIASTLTETAFMRFQQEAKAITSLRHPNIIMVHEFGVAEDGEPFMVMDFIEGSNLGELIKEKGSLTVEESMHRFIQLCDALQHAHAAGVLHRDLKPGNVMLSSSDGSFADARLVDFGIAKLMAKEGEEAEKLTMTGQLFGSPPYMSPEQCRGFALDARTDIYSMGCVMFEALTGRVPIRGQSVLETIMMQVSESAPAMKEVCPEKDFPPILENIIAKALAKDPDDRYQTMRELMVALMEAGIEMRAPGTIQTTAIPTIPEKRFSVPLSVYTGVLCFVATAFALSGWLIGVGNKHEVKSIEVTRQVATDLLLWAPRKDLTDQMLKSLVQPDLVINNLDLEGAENISDLGFAPISKIQLVERVSAKNTKLGDDGLAKIVQLPNLRSLELTGTQVTDKGVENLRKAKNLSSLSLNLTRVTDRGLSIIGQMNKLSTLAIGYLPAVTSSGLCQLKDLHLSTVDFSGLQITPSVMSMLAGKHSLKWIILQDSSLSDTSIKEIANMSRLQKLNINGTPVGDEGFAQLTKLNSLWQLQAGQTNVGDNGISHLLNLPRLRELNLNSTKITDEGVAKLSQIKTLRKLCLVGNQIGDQSLRSLSNLPYLQELDMDGTNITNDGLKWLKNYKSLTYICLSRCNHLSRTEVERIAEEITHREETDAARAESDMNSASQKRPEIGSRLQVDFNPPSSGW